MSDPTISAEQLQAARVGLNLSYEKLSQMTSIGVRTLSRFEKGEHLPTPFYRRALRHAMEQLGVQFNEDGTVVLPPSPA